ncbi:MAG: YggS family pyridoxal phosphate-dependent enzyme [Defluviitaleaceae bacterium]|nr:YggS family pyridoxal phosphate-dependent enzyme [Defluviitaleaceae bacterium]
MSIYENVNAIRQQIAASARKAGRKPEEIKLIGVTKTICTSRISELLAAGVEIIGENRVQELLPKYEFFQKERIRPREWHFIGHLQKNKVKYIVDKVDLIHSVDSLDLALEINKRGEQIGKVVNILAEINIAGESSKHGIEPSEALEFAESLVNMRFVRLSGLMCIPPFVENAEDNRVFFRNLREIVGGIDKIFLDTKSISCHNEKPLELSMGMSADFSVAIEEGATMIRLGTALFGER